MFDILYNLHQNTRIAGAEAKAGAGLRQVERAGDRIAELEDRLDRLSLLNLALWTLLKEKTGLSESELAARVEEIDMRDGRLDGKVAGGVVNCPDCERPLAKRHRRCLYCGFQVENDGFEQIVR